MTSLFVLLGNKIPDKNDIGRVLFIPIYVMNALF